MLKKHFKSPDRVSQKILHPEGVEDMYGELEEVCMETHSINLRDDASIFFSSLAFYAFVAQTYFDKNCQLSRKSEIDYLYLDFVSYRDFLFFIRDEFKITSDSDFMETPSEEKRRSLIGLIKKYKVRNTPKIENRLFLSTALYSYLVFVNHLVKRENINKNELIFDRNIGYFDIKKIDEMSLDFLSFGKIEISLKSMLRRADEKVYEDYEQNEFYWQLEKSYPDYFEAFKAIGVSIFDANNLMKEEKYKKVMTDVKEMKDIKNKSALYKLAEKGDVSAMKFLTNLKKKSEGGADDDEKEDFISEIPEYLKEADLSIKNISSEDENIDVDLTTNT